MKKDTVFHKLNLELGIKEKFDLQIVEVHKDRKLTSKLYQKDLLIISDEKSFNNYINTYIAEYKAIHDQEPENILFYSCFFQNFNYEQNIEKQIKVEECFFENKCSDNFKASFLRTISFIKDSTFSNEAQGVLPIGAKYIKGLYSTGGLRFSESHLTNIISMGTIELSPTAGSSTIMNVKAKHTSINSNSKISKLETKTFVIKNSKRDLSLIIKDSILKTKANFSNQKFSQLHVTNTIFEYPPNFINATIDSKDFVMRDNIFKCCIGTAALGSFRNLKQIAENNHDEHNMLLFHRYELETYYNTYLSGSRLSLSEWVEKLSSQIYKKVTNYGSDLFRPFIALFTLFILFGLINLSHLSSTKSFLLSLKHSLGPFGLALSRKTLIGKEEIPLSLEFTSFVHLMVSGLMLFFIIFMIRRRFKIHDG